MPFNYEFNNNKNRKYRCFVCGKDHDDFANFKKHVTEFHEEGREFVICPLTRCQAPVRDLALHFKAKHCTEHLPKEKQQRAIVWKDQDKNSGKLKSAKPRFREGNFVSIKNGGKEMHYRSGMECEVYELLEAIPDVQSYKVEPFPVPYLFEANMHNYHPDLQIHWSDGKIEVWEIKPGKQTELPRNKAKWASCATYCQSRGWKFMVLTETGVRGLRQRVFNKGTK